MSEKANESVVIEINGKKYNRVPFCVEKAQKGAKIITRDNREVEFVKYDSKLRPSMCVICVLDDDDGLEVHQFNQNGNYYDNEEMRLDLFILEEVQKTVIKYLWAVHKEGYAPENNGKMYASEKDFRKDHKEWMFSEVKRLDWSATEFPEDSKEV